MQGRCAGCEAEGAYKDILAHVGRCPQFAEVFRTDSGRDLDPAVEYRRVAAERKPEPSVAKPRKVRAEVSAPVARVARSKQSPRPPRQASAGAEEPERVPGPVAVEYWGVPRGLLDVTT